MMLRNCNYLLNSVYWQVNGYKLQGFSTNSGMFSEDKSENINFLRWRRQIQLVYMSYQKMRERENVAGIQRDGIVPNWFQALNARQLLIWNQLKALKQRVKFYAVIISPPEMVSLLKYNPPCVVFVFLFFWFFLLVSSFSLYPYLNL